MHKSAIFMGSAGIFIPVAMYMIIEAGDQSRLWAFSLLLGGVLCLILAVGSAQSDEKKEDAKYLIQLRQNENSSKTLITEIKGFREDVKNFIEAISEGKNNDNKSNRKANL